MMRKIWLILVSLLSLLTAVAFAEDLGEPYLISVEIIRSTEMPSFSGTKTLMVSHVNQPSATSWGMKAEKKEDPDKNLSIQVTPLPEDQGCVPVAVVAKVNDEVVLDVQTSNLIGEKMRFETEGLSFFVTVDSKDQIPQPYQK